MKRIITFDTYLLEKLNTFDFKSLFIELTQYTIPFGEEQALEYILRRIVPGLQKDSFGNYHVTIGNSKTLFTSHLDTYSKRKEKVNHIINGNIIKTDETTILGGDNKNGVIILLHMITKQVPGHYYFFIGEEGITTGESCNGSNWLLKNNPKIYTTMDRAIAFDRRGKGSIVTKQRGRRCCSDTFADALITEFNQQGLTFQKDYAYGTDSAVFMDIVPEITNISSGGEYEHAFLESTDIGYVQMVAEAAVKINWEALPVERTATHVTTTRSKYTYNAYTIQRSKRTFKRMKTLLSIKGFLCINDDQFTPNTIMEFEQFTQDKTIKARVFYDKIKIVEDNYFNGEFTGGTITELEQHLNIPSDVVMKKVISSIVSKMNKEYYISKRDLGKILNNYDTYYYKFKEFIKASPEYKDLFKFFPTRVYMDIRATQSTTIKRQEEQQTKTNI